MRSRSAPPAASRPARRSGTPRRARWPGPPTRPARSGRGRSRRGTRRQRRRQPVEVGEAGREPDHTDRQRCCREPRHHLVGRERGQPRHLFEVRPVERAGNGDERVGPRPAASTDRDAGAAATTSRTTAASGASAVSAIARQHADGGQAAHHLDVSATERIRQRRHEGAPGRRVVDADQQGAVAEGPDLPHGDRARHAGAGANTSMPESAERAAHGLWRWPRRPASRRGCTACRPTA